eukprot:9742459-Alexandrium_andersonii.AAC.1
MAPTTGYASKRSCPEICCASEVLPRGCPPKRAPASREPPPRRARRPPTPPAARPAAPPEAPPQRESAH